MDNGMGENGGSNGILMEDEILDTPAVSAPQQPAQPQYGAAGQITQPTMQPQYGAVTQPQAGQPVQSSQYGATAQPRQESGMDAFNSAPSFDSMDGMNNSSNVINSSEIFGSSTGVTSTEWKNRHSDQVFRGSAAGRSMSADNAVYHERVSSNIFLGLIGALIGDLLGAVIWVVLYQLAYVGGIFSAYATAIGSAFAIALSIGGYVILGKGLDVKGVIICAVLGIVSIYFVHRVAFSVFWVIMMKKGWNIDMDFKTAYINLEKNMKDFDDLTRILHLDKKNALVTVIFYRDLIVAYVWALVTGVPMAFNMTARS